MKFLSVAGCVVLSLAASLGAAEVTIESAGAPPETIPEATRALIAADGVRVNGTDGKIVSEFWMRRTPFDGEGVSELGVRNDVIPLGSFLGVVRFSDSGHDFRDQSIPGGLYSMRFHLQPVDGNHYEPVRDFTLLVPIANDPDVEKNVDDYDALVAMSYEVGNPHPTVLHMAWSEGDETPNLWKNDYGHWVLDLAVGDEPVGFVVYGHAEH